MQQTSMLVFGKRTNAIHRTQIVAPVADPHATTSAAIRREIKDDTPLPRVVRRSFRAALLAGLVVGFCLAGLDARHPNVIAPGLTSLLALDGISIDGDQALPYLIAFSLFSGARIAATTVLILHRLLASIGQSTCLAYALGGAAMAAAYAVLVMAIGGSAPQHGWVVDIAAGAGAGFFYRMFAGAAPMTRARDDTRLNSEKRSRF